MVPNSTLMICTHQRGKEYGLLSISFCSKLTSRITLLSFSALLPLSEEHTTCELCGVVLGCVVSPLPNLLTHTFSSWTACLCRYSPDTHLSMQPVGGWRLREILSWMSLLTVTRCVPDEITGMLCVPGICTSLGITGLFAQKGIVLPDMVSCQFTTISMSQELKLFYSI